MQNLHALLKYRRKSRTKAGCQRVQSRKRTLNRTFIAERYTEDHPNLRLIPTLSLDRSHDPVKGNALIRFFTPVTERRTEAHSMVSADVMFHPFGSKEGHFSRHSLGDSENVERYMTTRTYLAQDTPSNTCT